MRYAVLLMLAITACELESVGTTEAEPMRMHWTDEATEASYESMAGLTAALVAEVDAPLGTEVRLVPWGGGHLNNAELDALQREHLPPNALAVLEAAMERYPPGGAKIDREMVVFACTEQDGVWMPAGGVDRTANMSGGGQLAHCTTWPLGMGPSPRAVEDCLAGGTP